MASNEDFKSSHMQKQRNANRKPNGRKTKSRNDENKVTKTKAESGAMCVNAVKGILNE